MEKVDDIMDNDDDDNNNNNNDDDSGGGGMIWKNLPTFLDSAEYGGIDY
jgi:hypothetical protein